MTRDTYLEMTFRHGRPLAGYIYLPRRDGDRAVRSRKAAEGLVVDYAADGRPIGIEIVSPSLVTAEAINGVLAQLQQSALSAEDLSPLCAK